MNSPAEYFLSIRYKMSDTEEVVLSRSAPKRDTKPQIAREKLKEKRERLKKEKENLLIEEAKKRLAEDNKKAEQEALIAKQQEEEKKLQDPSYIMLKRMEEMMARFQSNQTNIVSETKVEPEPQPVKKRASKKKVEIPEPEPEPEPEKPKRKPKQVVDKPNKAPGLPKPRKKVVYLAKNEVLEDGSTQFLGYDIAPPAEPIQYNPSSGLLSALMGRRNMNTAY
jgi:hypothetical protein